MYFVNSKLGEKCYHEDFNSVWERWTRWLWKSVLKQEPSGIQVNTFLGLNRLTNIYAMKLISFLKICKILWRFQKLNKNSGKCFPFLSEWPLNILRKILSLMARIHVIGSQRVNKQYWDLKYDLKRCFLIQFLFY